MTTDVTDRAALGGVPRWAPPLLMVVIAVFGGLLFGAAGTAMIPAQQLVVAPVVCDGYERAVVVRTVSTDAEGTSVSSVLWCLDGPDGRRQAASAAYTLLIGGWTAIWLVLIVLVRVVSRRNRRTASAAMVLLLLLGGCAWGTVDATEFNAHPQRYAGLHYNGTVGVEEVFEAIESAQGAPVRFVSATFHGHYAIIDAVVPGRSGDVDRWQIRDGVLIGPDPQQVTGSVEAAAMSPGDFAIDRLDAMTMTALDAVALDDDAHVSFISMQRLSDGTRRWVMSITSIRRRATALFTSDGDLIEAVVR